MNKETVQKLMDMAWSLFKTKGLPAIEKAATNSVAQPVAPVQVTIEPTPVVPAEIDWGNPRGRLSKYFSVKDALMLNSWSAMHLPSEEEKTAIKGISEKATQMMEILAKELGHEVIVNVHAWMRPEVANIAGSKWNGKDYNRYIYETQVWKGLSAEEMAQKHVPNSPHKTGHAIDFHIIGYEGKEGCAKIRAILLPHLEALGLRMENLDGGWVHLDDLPVVHARFFKP